jgi:chromosome segregation ATPase
MTTARELYTKVTGDLDSATRKRDSLKAAFAGAAARISSAETELRFIVWKLMPEAREALPQMFAELSEAFRQAEDAHASSVGNLQDAETRVGTLKGKYEQAREDLGVYADGARAAMRSSPEYQRAEDAAASAEAVLQENAQKLEEAEKRLARFTELAGQSLMHRTLLSAHAKDESQGHFLLSLWHSMGRGLRETEWFRRMDEDRATAERDVRSGGDVRDKAIMEGAMWKASMQQLNADFETALQPRRSALQEKVVELEKAEGSARNAKSAHLAAERHLADLQAGRVEPALAARAALASLLSREFGTASQEDLTAIKTLAGRPEAGGLVERAMECADEMRLATVDRISLMEEIDAVLATIDELEKVKRKMSRSGLHRSSKQIDNAENFMRSDTSDGFDLETLAALTIVADAVSDMGSSSSSDWSSGSSWGSSSFD